MGGTTAKLCLIDDYEPLMSRSFEVDRVYRFRKGSGLPVRIPVIEMVEIGAGGGSIAGIDKLRRIQVGPESAGSEPGPACYGLGGDRATVTDADVRLGRVHAAKFAGGSLQLDSAAADRAIDTDICQPLELELDDGAFGIAEVVDENMTAAARAHSAEFGLDLGNRDMIAFGGAGPLHAARLGEKLGVNRILIPANAGVGSAIGFLLADISFEVVRSRRQRLSALDVALVNHLMNDMHAEAMAVVRQGSSVTDLVETRHAYMRYVGQGHEIPVALPGGTYGDEHAGVFRDAFEAAYTALYGRTIGGVDIEVLSWTLMISAPSEKEAPDASRMHAISTPDPIARQPLFDPATSSRIDAPVYLRQDLQPGQCITGPALITEDQTTTVVTSRFEALIDARDNIVLTQRRES